MDPRRWRRCSRATRCGRPTQDDPSEIARSEFEVGPPDLGGPNPFRATPRNHRGIGLFVGIYRGIESFPKVFLNGGAISGFRVHPLEWVIMAELLKPKLSEKLAGPIW